MKTRVSTMVREAFGPSVQVALDLWYVYHHFRFCGLVRHGDDHFSLVLRLASGASHCVKGNLREVARAAADTLRAAT